jgi:hypothetical protein
MLAKKPAEGRVERVEKQIYEVVQPVSPKPLSSEQYHNGLPGALEAAISGLDWPEPAGPDDWPWLATWLRSPRGRASYILADDGPEALATAVRAALPARFAPPAPGGNVGAAQGGA